jgi:hypothetical protein
MPKGMLKRSILKAIWEATGMLIMLSFITWAVLIAAVVAIIGMCSQGEGRL